MQQGRCPVVGCGAAIGGESHVNVRHGGSMGGKWKQLYSNYVQL